MKTTANSSETTAPSGTMGAPAPSAERAVGRTAKRKAVSGRGQRTGPAPLPAKFRSQVIAAGREFRRLFGMVDRPTAERLARVFRTTITPRKKPGRPMSQEVDTALRLRGKGSPWCDIYPKAISGYAGMEFWERCYRKFRLRTAVRQSTRRRAKRKASSSPR